MINVNHNSVKDIEDKFEVSISSANGDVTIIGKDDEK
jgi:hypothetical protein